MGAPVRITIISPAKWPGEPLPTEANENLSGAALAWATTSATVRTGTAVLATKICGSDATRPTGSKSLIVSNGSLGKIAGLMVCELSVNSTV